MIYLDYNATCPVANEVQEAIKDGLQFWANPSSKSSLGKKAKGCIEEARNFLAELLDCHSSEIIFTSGGTEANNLVITSSIEYFNTVYNCISDNNLAYVKPHVISSQIEHDSVKLFLEHLEKKEIIDLTLVPVDPKTGYILVDDIFTNIVPNTCLISIMLANNETGVLQPIEEISQKIMQVNARRSLRILFHTDAAQAIGKIPVSVKNLGVDYLTVVGQKFYGPRNGALFAKMDPSTGQPLLFPSLIGGGQERGYRPGTENTPMIIGLGEAARLAGQYLKKCENHMRQIRDYLEEKLKAELGNDDVDFHFSESLRLPNTASIAFPKYQGSGASLLAACLTFTASTGAACHAGINASTILLSCGVELRLAERTVRFSCGRETNEADIDIVVNELKKLVVG